MMLFGSILGLPPASQGTVSRKGDIGSSDEDGVMPKDRPVKVPDLHASICHALGINHNLEVQTPLQRPMKLVDKGTPVEELFS